ncbi:MAG: hypothetical protein WHS87_07895 [Anaerolineales bacterium]
MTEKGIGFARTVKLDWLDRTATLRLETSDAVALRLALDEYLKPILKGGEFRRKTIDVLLGIWHKTETVSPSLHAAALRLYREVYTSEERLWLHYGLALIRYPHFRLVTSIIGQLGRLSNALTRRQIKAQVAAQVGHLGDLDRSVERICASLTEWGLFPQAEKPYTYRPAIGRLHTENNALRTWLLACALQAHPADSLPLEDLIRLPELFPFRLSDLRAEHLMESGWFQVTRQVDWEMVQLA